MKRSRSSPGRAATSSPVSVGLLGNAAEIYPELVRRGMRPDAVTDQTSAHDPVNGYLPRGWTLGAMGLGRESTIPRRLNGPARQLDGRASAIAMLEFHKSGVPTFDYGNNIRQMAKDEGVADAFSFPGFVPAYIRPLFCRGIGPFRWVALSGDPEDIYRSDEKVKELLPERQAPAQLARPGPARRSSFRVCPRGSAGWAWATGTGWDWHSTRWSASGRAESADRDRPRPS